MADPPTNLFAERVAQLPYAAVICTTTNGRIVYASRAATDYFATALQVSEPVGKTTVEMGLWPSNADRLRALEQARKANAPLPRVPRNAHGALAAELFSGQSVTLDGNEYPISTLVDISDAGTAEAELADALDRLERAQSLAKIGDFVTELNEQFNGSAEAMRVLGFEPKAATATTKELFRQFHPDDKAMIARAVADLLPAGSFAIEHRLAPELGERWVYTQATVETRDGKPFVRGTVQDITERKREEEERARLNAKMQEAQKLESLGLLSGGIAHDFNNLLAGIMGNADFALMEANVPPAIEKRLQDIINASKRAADLTRQLLAYSGKGRFVIEPTNLSTTIDEMASLLDVTISKSHTLSFFLEDDIPAVEADRTQLRQVIMNLIINASEAISHNHGTLSLTTGTQMCDAEYLATSDLTGELPPGHYAFFEISDNGDGMDAETIGKIYDPFFSTKFTGRGLGMAAVHGIIRGHGGAIKVYSELGRGTTFKVFLPVVDAEAVVHEPSTADQQRWTGSGGILVVDDEASIRDFATSVLTRYGYDVFVAADGVQGLDVYRARRREIVLVLLDLTMPNADGQQTFAKLRALDPNVRAILMSGYNEQDATQHFVGKRLAGFLPKPFLVSDLMNAVSEALDPANDHQEM